MGGPSYAETTTRHKESGLKPARIIRSEVDVRDLRHDRYIAASGPKKSTRVSEKLVMYARHVVT